MKNNLYIFFSKYPSLFAMLTVIVIKIASITEAECMDNDHVKDTLEAYQRDELSEDEIIQLIRELENINDPNIANILRQNINQFARENNINVNAILPANLQHDIQGLEGNPGTLPQIQQPNRTWLDILSAIGIAVTITVIIYIIMRNWDAIKEFLFDIGNRALTLPRNTDSRIIFRIAGVLLNNPNTRNAFANRLRRGFVTHINEE